MGQEQSGNGGVSVGGPNGIRIESGQIQVGGIYVSNVTTTQHGHGADALVSVSKVPALLESHPGAFAGALAGGAVITAVTGVALVAALALPAVLYAIPITLAAALIVAALVVRTKYAHRDVRTTDDDVEHRLLELASSSGGCLTVTGTARSLGISLARADKALTELAKSGYVSMDNDPDTGVVLYTFPEIAASPDGQSSRRKLT